MHVVCVSTLTQQKAEMCKGLKGQFVQDAHTQGRKLFSCVLGGTVSDSLRLPVVKVLATSVLNTRGVEFVMLNSL